jgi:hypothetical protein
MHRTPNSLGRPFLVSPAVHSDAGAALGVIVVPADKARPSRIAGWQPIDVMLGRVKPAENTPSIMESLSRLLG